MKTSERRSVWIAIAITLMMISGCGDDSDEPTAGMSGGASGMSGGSGGTGGGGTGGGGTGGGGTGGGGTGGGEPQTPAGCDAAVDGMPADLHTAAVSVLTVQGKCSFEGTCHSKETQSAGLILLDSMDLNALLVDQASCVAPDLPLVKSGGGEEALQGSWLWLKLVAPADESGVLMDNSAWGAPAGSCNQSGDQPRGTRMPQGGTADFAAPDRLAAIRNWICAGAPGPQ